MEDTLLVENEDGSKLPHPALGVCQTILELIGNTPIVALNKIARQEGLECSLLAKCEFLSVGGSVKDRIALQMIESAEAAGKLVPGKSTIIEASSGNTGIGLALVGAVKGYRTIVTLHDRRSAAKVNVMKALGAEVVRASSEEPWDSPNSYFSIATKLHKEIPGAIILDQFRNDDNPRTHESRTAVEIINQIYRSGLQKVDLVVAGAGTGGTLTGLSRGLRKEWADLQIYGVDPEGSILARPTELNASEEIFHLEGIGLPFVPGTTQLMNIALIPDVMDHQSITGWIKINDQESFSMSRRLIRSEGLLCGGSSGAAVVAAVKLVKQLQLGVESTVLVILPDSIRDYIYKVHIP